MADPSPIRNVSDTAPWVAIYRTMETSGRFGWREREFRSTWDESFRLKRTMRGACFFSMLSKLQPKAQLDASRRMSGIVLLESR